MVKRLTVLTSFGKVALVVCLLNMCVLQFNGGLCPKPKQKNFVSSDLRHTGGPTVIFVNASSHTDQIPDHMYSYIDQLVNGLVSTPWECSEQQLHENVVYLKVHKCASDTLSAMLRRFAIDRQLSVVLPLDNSYFLGWPQQLRSEQYFPPLKGSFNMIVDHMIYNRPFLSEIMPKDTKYVASLREPMARLPSALSYYAMQKCGLMSSNLENITSVTEEFMHRMDFYDSNHKTKENTKPGCFQLSVSLVQNSMAFDLGFPLGFHVNAPDMSRNYRFIMKWLQDIHKELDLVIIAEYFHESLILIKRHLCWSNKDIMYRRLNDRKIPQVHYEKRLTEKFYNWSNVDTLIYRLFNKTLWARINSIGSKFWEDYKEYMDQKQAVDQFCTISLAGHLPKTECLAFNENKWSRSYEFSHLDCVYMHDKKDLRELIKMKYGREKRALRKKQKGKTA